MATPTLVAVLIALLLLIAAGIGLGSAALSSARATRYDVVQLALPEQSPAAQESALVVDTIEVPPLEGLELAEAETVLSAAGLKIETRNAGISDAGGVAVVSEQNPAVGTLVGVGTTVTLTMRSDVDTSTVAPREGSKSKKRAYVVCIDPGHQGRSDTSPEPIGPGSKTMKERVNGGASGISTEVSEYEVALQISMNLKKRLGSEGVRVVMTRTTNDVNISNAERARKANKSGADLFVRVHGNGSPDTSISGVSVIYPAKNRWTSRIVGPSKRAARLVCARLAAETGAINRGVRSADELAGFNWSKVPVILVECGYHSNSVEDRLLVSPYYQDKIAQGITDGVMTYLQEEEKR